MDLRLLFEKLNEKEAIDNEIAENYGEVTDEQLSTLADIDAITEENAEQLCNWYRCKLNDAEDCKKRAQNWAKKQKAAERSAEWVGELILQVMKKRGVDRSTYGDYDVRVKKSYRVTIENGGLDRLPAELKRVKMITEPDKKAIGELLKQGVELEGCRREEYENLKIN